MAASVQSIQNDSRAAPSRRAIAYWSATLFVTVTALVAGMMDILRLPPLFGLLLHLGYPPYFATILGVWKVLGAIVLLLPGYALFKEWAYAGMVIDYSSAFISHLASGDGAGPASGPLISMGILALSWYLRPQSRRWPALTK